MAHRFAVTITSPFPHCLAPLFAALVLLALISAPLRAQAAPEGPDTEAFKAAKAEYFKNPAQAAESFRTFMDKYRDSQWTPEAYYWLAKSLETSRADQAEIIKAYMLFLRRYPDHKLADEASFAIAEVYRNRRTGGNEDLERALERYDTFVKTYPKSDRVAEAWFRAGDVQLTLKRNDKALEDFAKVLTDFPRSPFVVPAKLGQADSLGRLDRNDEARAVYDDLLKTTLTDWDAMRARLGLLSLYLKMNKLPEALAQADTIRTEAGKPGHFQDWPTYESYRRLAEYYQKSKDYDKAVAELNAFIERFPSSNTVWTARAAIGEMYIAAGKMNEARTELAKVANDHPKAKDKNPPDQVLYARYRIAFTYALEKNYDEALKRYQQLLDENPGAQISFQTKKRVEEVKKLIADRNKEKK